MISTDNGASFQANRQICNSCTLHAIVQRNWYKKNGGKRAKGVLKVL